MKSAHSDLAELSARAGGGDAEAQYRLAALLFERGRKDEASALLARAAAAGHAGALFTKASALLAGRPDPATGAEAYALFGEAAARGAHGARLKQGVLHAFGLGAPRDWTLAVESLLGAVDAQYPPALRQAGALAMIGGEPRGGRLIAEAAKRGDRLAPSLLAHVRESAAGALSPREIADALESAPRTIPLATETLRAAAPRVVRLQALFPPLACAYVMRAAEPLLARSAVVDSARRAGVEAAFRTSDGAAFGLADVDLMLFALHARLAGAAGARIEETEFMGVLRYRPGEEYRPHHDYLPEDEADYSEVRRAGQRRLTVLVSLNDAYEGGETAFPRLGLAARNRAGDALVFENVGAGGVPEPDSLHAGQPVRAGEKWMLTVWARERRFWPW